MSAFSPLLSKENKNTTVRRTKIVCSIGPACKSVEVLEKLLDAGVNVFRLNFSFGNHDEMREYVKLMEQASKNTKKPFSILGDLQGPKFRTGDFEEGGIPITPGQKIKLIYTKEIKGNKELITCPNERLLKAIGVEDRILIADGAMEIKVIEKLSPTEAMTQVIRGGELKSRKGLNVPTAVIKFDELLDKDKADALFMIDIEADYIGQSFVQNAEDVTKLKTFLAKNAVQGKRAPKIIAKIEKPQALKDIDSILSVADGIMVARGDLGVELSLEMVPIAQKQLIKKANEAKKPVITATQMLQSMVTEAVPTRAEVSDVANAVFDGTDCVMTSNETAVSPHPPTVIQTMNKILLTAESYLAVTPSSNFEPERFHIAEAVASSALAAAEKAKAKAIIVYSVHGSMATLVSKGRPRCPVFVVTPLEDTAKKTRFLYATYPIVLPFGKYAETTVAAAEEEILTKGWLRASDVVVMCSGVVSNLPGLTNITKIYKIGEYLGSLASAFKKLTPPSTAEPEDLTLPPIQNLHHSTANAEQH